MERKEDFAAAYDELKELAKAMMAKERASHTLSPTALLHDAYLKVSQRGDAAYVDREHFFRVAVKAMRQILIDHARTKGRAKRGGSYGRLGIEDVDIAAAPTERDFEMDDLGALAEALKVLEADDPQLSRIVGLRYFANATMGDIAAELGVSERTVYNDWSAARAKLRALLPS